MSRVRRPEAQAREHEATNKMRCRRAARLQTSLHTRIAFRHEPSRASLSRALWHARAVPSCLASFRRQAHRGVQEIPPARLEAGSLGTIDAPCQPARSPPAHTSALRRRQAALYRCEDGTPRTAEYRDRMQLFVRAAGTHCLEVPAGASAADVLSALEARTGAVLSCWARGDGSVAVRALCPPCPACSV